MSMKGEKYSSKKMMKKHEKMEGKKEKMMEYGKKKAVKKMAMKKMGKKKMRMRPYTRPAATTSESLEKRRRAGSSPR